MAHIKTATLTFRIDPSLKEALRIAAHAEHRSIANMIEWAAAGFTDTLLRWKLRPEVGYGNETAIQPGVQA